MNKNTINNNHADNNNLSGSIPLIVVDSVQDRYLRIIKWFIIIIGILIVSFASYAIYNQYLWNQYDYSTTETRTITVDGEDGNANYAESGGSITNGKDYSDDNKDKNKEKEERSEQRDENQEKEVTE